MFGDFTQMMKQMQAMQEKMQAMQKDMSQITETGVAGNLVRVSMNGEGVVTAVDIDDSLMKDGDKEILCDLIKSATNDAKRRIKGRQEEFTQKAFGGMLPPGFKLPF